MSARILVVEDSVAHRNLVRRILERAGHQVVAEEATGEDAVHAYERVRPDVVIMDLVMPRMNGCDAARRILGIDPRARIIAMSGLSQPSVQAAAEESGALGFVPKPIDAGDLLAEVHAALEG